ncbi:MAG: PD-(D/E)XK nuclease family protein, partial [Myxococcota bacterium]
MRLVVSVDAASRLREARKWLAKRERDERLWVVGATREAAVSLVRDVLEEHGGASFGWEPISQGALVARWSALSLGRKGLAPATRLALEALAMRLVHRINSEGALGRLSPLGDQPGFPRALVATFDDLRLAEVPAGALEDAGHPELELLRARYEGELRLARLADRAEVLRAAAEHPAEGALWLDPALRVPLEAALVQKGTDSLVTLPEADARGLALLDTPATRITSTAASTLARAQAQLFGAKPVEAAPDETLVIVSAPGESRECVELARRCQQAAKQGVPFSRMAIAAHATSHYRPHLIEAFRRAGIPLRFTRASQAPDPAGRALLALLACRSEGLSARAFGEYLSLAVVPSLEEGAPPAAADRWVPPDEDRLPFPVDDVARTPPEAALLQGPRDWEALIVDAAVIGGRDRWARRLERLDAQLARDAASLDPDDPRVDRLTRRRHGLRALRDFALPLLEELAQLPEDAPWGEWLAALRALATRALRQPDHVLQVLGELAPLAPVGPVRVEEVIRVLTPRLAQLSVRTNARQSGVLVASPAEVRGLAFDRVLVPGLTERVFPKRIYEDPLLLDGARTNLSPHLPTKETRMRDERLALHLALGAASTHAVVSWPEVDADRGRPRVPSFYVLEIARAAYGSLPGFRAIKMEAAAASATHSGWPAPAKARDAIDDAEYDLAALRESTRSRASGGMAYLLAANPHVKRALGFRARRWSPKWNHADGLVVVGDAAHKQTLLAPFLPGAKPYSATALQNFAACPYRFALYALFRLETREEPESIEQLNPLQRGSLVHDIQFETLTRARAQGLLPLSHPQNLAATRELLDQVVEEVASEYAEELMPAIPRVWDDALADIRGDLQEWLGILHELEFDPQAFELSFGLTRGDRRDEGSLPDPVLLEHEMLLRGAIDLVEAGPENQLRATDHKSGRVPPWMGKDVRIGGGRALQPLLYALALETMFPDSKVVGGRLFYCTSRG